MKKYRVYGTTTIDVTTEVWANSEEEAYEKYKLEDIPFVSRPSSASYVSKILGKLKKLFPAINYFITFL